MMVRFVMRLAAHLEQGRPLKSRYATANRTPDGTFAVLDIAEDTARVFPDAWTAATIWDLITRDGIAKQSLTQNTERDKRQ